MKILIWLLAFLILFALIPKLAISVEAHQTSKMPLYEDLDLSPRDYSVYAVLDRFGGKEWTYFNKIVEKESNWEVLGHHYPISKKSSASGLCGFLDQTWIDYGYEKTEDPYIQIDACIDYIENRYELPSKALKFHKRKNWF